MHVGNLLKYTIFSLFAMLFCFQVNGQKVEGRVLVLDKPAEVGRPFKVKLEINHPEEVPVIFPDTISLEPFEFVKKDLTVTQTDNGLSIDQAVYHLYTWEVAEKQPVRFPFKYVLGNDTIQSISSVDTAVVTQKIAVVSDTLKLKFIQGLTRVDEPVNRTLMTILIIAAIVILIGAVILLRKPVTRKIRRWRIERDWKKVLAHLESLNGKIEQQEAFILELNQLWKNYLDNPSARLESRTTPELERILNRVPGLTDLDIDTLVDANRSGDKILYAKVPETREKLSQLLNSLREVLQKSYEQRKEVIEI